MAISARLAFSARRNEARRWTMRFVGLDLTDVEVRMQVRLRPDTPGPAPIALESVDGPDDEGLRLLPVETVDGVPVSTVTGFITKATMSDAEKVPYSGELGDDSRLSYALQVRGVTRLTGDFFALASVMDSDAAPLDRPESYGRTTAGAADNDTITLTIVDEEVISVTIDDAAAIGKFAERAESAALKAEDIIGALGEFRLEAMEHPRWSHRLVTGNGWIVGAVERTTGRLALQLTADSKVPVAAVFGSAITGLLETDPVATGWLRRFITANGWVLGGFEVDGTWAVPALNIGNGARLEPSDPDETGYFMTVTDAAGNLRMALDRNFQLLADHSPTAIFPDGVGSGGGAGACDFVLLGDSLIEELGTDGIGAQGRNVQNQGVGGQAHEIAVRAGVGFVTISVQNNMIPASGSVLVTAYDIDIGYASGYSAARSVAGTVNGVAVIMQGQGDGTPPDANGVHHDGTYRLVRVTDGEAVDCPPGSHFVSTQLDPYLGRTVILGLGRNFPGPISPILDDHIGILRRLTAAGRRVLVLDIPNGTNEGPEFRVEQNEKLAQALGQVVVPRRRFLNQQGVERAVQLGLLSGPTAEDNAARAADRLPPSLTSDGLHLNATGRQVLKWFINAHLTARGWY